MIATEIAEDRCEWHLDNWATWHRTSGRAIARWYPSRASGGIAGSGSSDLDTMVAVVDVACAKAVDAIVDELPVRNRDAVYHFKLAKEYRLDGDVHVLYDNAKLLIMSGLAKWIIW